jgi:hypothetical protein
LDRNCRAGREFTTNQPGGKILPDSDYATARMLLSTLSDRTLQLAMVDYIKSISMQMA